MKESVKKLGLLISAVVLATGFMFLFFGGTWEGVRFGLELLGAVFILQTCYSTLKKGCQENQDKKDLKEKYG